MHRQFSASEQAFATQISEFLGGFVEPASGDIWRNPQFCDALVARGWSVPTWPPAWGGAGWTPVQEYLWYRACHQRFALFAEPIAIHLVGPLLIARASPAQQQRWLPDIAACRARWCVAPPTAGVPLPELTGTRLSARFNGVADADDAHCMLTAARQGDELVLLALPMDEAELEAQHLLSGERAWRVSFSEAAIDPALQIERVPESLGPTQSALGGEAAFRAWFGGLWLSPSEKSAEAGIAHSWTAQHARATTLQAALTLAQEEMAELTDAGDLFERLAELHIEVAGLHALGQRCLDALTRGEPLPVSATQLQTREQAMGVKIGALLVDTFGYYALPLSDPSLSHNEVAPGPARAVAARQLVQRLHRSHT